MLDIIFLAWYNNVMYYCFLFKLYPLRLYHLQVHEVKYVFLEVGESQQK